ncbi:type II toxin-antitoxin system RelE/ParE family toxin [Pseudomonas sp. CAN2814]|uniref:type II toxin-antitoxin system RelE/ParE family toxin n=1 Tax=Pseudomonas sp. CAN1 TaxID=3046726 RepID=UPI002647C257|nr:type II toxin-antitoxin system RelE/ParE family toxin [Pseudomonas sp. CAN1]MDN6858763.1 type II toxin-antitoxin system RelE/ParE family toxin [Pseudomonas sp. CAN1]
MRVIYAPAALRDLERLRRFLRETNPAAARRAGRIIIEATQALAAYPQMGRLIDDLPVDFREWPIDFGDSGYLARYRIDGDTLVILAIRHQREVGY